MSDGTVNSGLEEEQISKDGSVWRQAPKNNFYLICLKFICLNSILFLFLILLQFIYTFLNPIFLLIGAKGSNIKTGKTDAFPLAHPIHFSFTLWPQTSICIFPLFSFNRRTKTFLVIFPSYFLSHKYRQ